MDQNSATPDPEPKPAPARVLVFEDNDDARALMAEGLDGAGYQVEKAKSGKDGILKSLEASPDIFLINPHLTGMDGFKVVRMIKTIEPIRRRPVFALLDNAAKADILKAAQAGADACLSKDISIHSIHLRFQQTLKQRRPEPAPLFENLRYTAVWEKDTLTLQIESELSGPVCKELVQLVRLLIPIQPITICISFEKVTAIATSAIGYLSEVKDTAKDCGGKLFLSKLTESKYPQNIMRIIKTNFQIQ